MDRIGLLEGKVALISGAASGMGAEHARLFIDEGATVVLGDISDEAGLALAERLGDKAAFAHLDVADPDDWHRAIEFAESRFGTVEVLVNNAGIGRRTPIDEETLDGFRSVIEVNLIGTFNGIRAVVPGMKRLGHGSIVNVSSISGLKGWWHSPGYTASKFGITGLTKAAALDLGVYGIRVNSVNPGIIETPMKGDLNFLTDHLALRRAGTAREISPLVLFLASDQASFSTGSVFVADGGETAGRRGPAFAELPDD